MFPQLSNLRSHVLIHNKEGDWRCNSCSFQTNSISNLKTHLDTAQHLSNQFKDLVIVSWFCESQFNCPLCDSTFLSKKELNTHRVMYHKSFKPCRNLPNCSFAENCMFNHDSIDPSKHLCFECGIQNKSLSDLMAHRKLEHRQVKCRSFSNGTCPFTSSS